MRNRPRPMWRAWVAGSLLWCSLPAMAQGAETPDPHVLLERMIHAVSESSYQGSMIYRRGDSFASMRMIHRVLPGGDTSEDVVSLDGVPGRIVRAGSEASFEFENGHDIQVSRIRPASPRGFFTGSMPKLLDSLEDNYRLILVGEDRDAGWNAWVISVIPRDEYRHGYHFHIDSKHYLMLRALVVDTAGNIIEELSFISLERLPQSEDPSPTVVHGGHSVAHLVEKPPPIMAFWEFSGLPPGFALLREHSRVLEIEETSVMQWVFSDGLARASLFVEPSGDPRLPDGFARSSGMQAYTKTTGGYQWTAMGAVPERTLQAIVEAAPAMPTTAVE